MSLENNRLLTYNDLNLFLSPKGYALSGNRIASKQVISDNYFVDELATPWQFYSSNRLPAYQYVRTPSIRCDYFTFQTADYEDEVTYYDCDGVQKYLYLPAFYSIDICARNNPYPSLAYGNGSINYIGNCPY